MAEEENVDEALQDEAEESKEEEEPIEEEETQKEEEEGTESAAKSVSRPVSRIDTEELPPPYPLPPGLGEGMISYIQEKE